MTLPSQESVDQNADNSENPSQVSSILDTQLSRRKILGGMAIAAGATALASTPYAVKSILYDAAPNPTENKTNARESEIVEWGEYILEQERFIVSDNDIAQNAGLFVLNKGDEAFRLGVIDKRTKEKVSFFSTVGPGENAISDNIINESWFDNNTGKFLQEDYIIQALIPLYKTQKKIWEAYGVKKSDVFFINYDRNLHYTKSGSFRNGNIELNGQALERFDANGLETTRKSAIGIESTILYLAHELIHTRFNFIMPAEEALTEALAMYALKNQNIIRNTIPGDPKLSYLEKNITSGTRGYEFVYFTLAEQSRLAANVKETAEVTPKNLNLEGLSINYKEFILFYSLFSKAGLSVDKDDPYNMRNFFEFIETETKHLSRNENYDINSFYEKVRQFAPNGESLPEGFDEYINAMLPNLLAPIEGFEESEDIFSEYRRAIEVSKNILNFSQEELSELSSDPNQLSVIALNIEPAEILYRDFDNLPPGNYQIRVPSVLNEEGFNIGCYYRDPQGTVFDIQESMDITITDAEDKGALIANCSYKSSMGNLIKIVKVAD